MIDVHADADAEGEDDADGEQVREYVDDDLQLCVERDGGHAEDVAHGRNDRWVRDGTDVWMEEGRTVFCDT